MQMPQLQAMVLACVQDPTLTYRQRVQRLAALAENALEPPEVGPECLEAQTEGVVHDMGEGNAPYRPRYLLPDYATALAKGSAHLELGPPQNLDDALAFLLAMYPNVPSITGYPVYLGDLDTLLEPFTAEFDPTDDDARLRARLSRFWRTLDRTLPDAFVHADLGPGDGRTVRALLRVDRELRQVVPNLTLRVDPQQTPDDLLAEAVRTACADGKPHFVNHPMMTADLGPAYGVVSCYNSLPRGGGSYTLVRLNLAESVRRHQGTFKSYLDQTLPRDVALTAELMAARIRFLVERSGYFEHDWLVRERLIRREAFTAMFGVFGVAEAVDELTAREHAWGIDGGTALYGRDRRANALGYRMIQKLSELVTATPMPYCEASGGHALLHAQSGIDTDVDVTAGARIPPGREPGLYRHIRMVAPQHHFFPAGISDVFRFESTVADNPQAVVAVMRGAFVSGMRDFTFDVVGNGFVRITGYLVRDADVARVADGARHSSTFLGAAAITNQGLDRRVPKAAGD
jgi:YjjI family glycine radical enzyme